VDTSENEDEDCDHHREPDIVAYIPGYSRCGTTDFSRIEVTIVVKPDEFHDPFKDLHPLDERPATDYNTRVEADMSEGMKTLGQMTTYVAAQMAQQLRPWAFSVVIFGCYARVVRWDRSGAVFTSRFDYKTSGHLERFFTSYGNLEGRSRGVDASITILEEGDQRVEVAKNGIGFRSRQGPQPCFYEFRLGPDRTVVGYSPKSSVPSLFGRASRPFIVWDSASQKKQFLKDTWRIDLPEMVVEGEVYELLESNRVPNVASVIWHSNVDEQQTLTSKLCVNFSDTYAMRPLTPHKHYRLMLDKVGRPCTEHNNQYHFFTIVHQAMNGECGPSHPPVIADGHPDIVPAHWLAYSLAKILHGGISVQNIMIDEDGNGMLIDWDYSKPVDPGEPCRGGRTVSMLDFHYLIILTHLTGNLGVHLCQPLTEAQCHSFL